MHPQPRLSYHKAEPTTLREAGFDERWLQERIQDDPSILGLGDLTVMSRERPQSVGGRLDFLLKEPETEVMYEVELMLGRLNESHIIRTIEYWDIERRRWPTREHRAVIVAEEITNRFFNVIGLFNRAIPMIAIQLDAFRVDEKIVLNFTTVLDIYEPPEEEEALAEPADRASWERRSNPESLGVFDRCLATLTETGSRVRVAYNRGSIALSGSRQTFAWFHPRKQSHCLVRLKLPDANRDSVAQALEEAGITVARVNWGRLSLPITPLDMGRSEGAIRHALKVAWQTVGEGASEELEE
jgi:hypothetical protein